MIDNGTTSTQYTTSLCPDCLTRIPAIKLREGDCLFLVKTCPEHGEFKTLVWRGDPAPENWLCNLFCPFCFAASGKQAEPDPSLESIADRFRNTLHKSGPHNVVQLSGGEPTMRDDLPDIINLCRELGFPFIQPGFGIHKTEY